MKLVKFLVSILCVLGATYIYATLDARPKTAQLTAEQQKTANADQAMSQLIAEAKKAVVFIFSKSGAGSGFFVREDGYILTAAHVVLLQTDQLQVCPFRVEDERYGSLEIPVCKPAVVVGLDEIRDLALLKVEGNGYPTLKLGDDPPAGHRIIALGHPMVYVWSATAGIVSKNPAFITGDQYFLQTDAAMYPGSSGGPLINLQGEVVGIADRVELFNGTPINIGFAIPVGDVKVLLPRLMQGGEIKHGSLRAAFIPLDDFHFLNPAIVKAYNMPKGVPGLVVKAVMPGGPAAKARLKAYDVILKIDGHTAGNTVELIRLISFKEPGTTIKLEVARNGRIMQIQAVLGEAPQPAAQLPQAHQSGKSGKIR